MVSWLQPPERGERKSVFITRLYSLSLLHRGQKSDCGWNVLLESTWAGEINKTWPDITNRLPTIKMTKHIFLRHRFENEHWTPLKYIPTLCSHLLSKAITCMQACVQAQSVAHVLYFISVNIVSLFNFPPSAAWTLSLIPQGEKTARNTTRLTDVSLNNNTTTPLKHTHTCTDLPEVQHTPLVWRDRRLTPAGTHN